MSNNVYSDDAGVTAIFSVEDGYEWERVSMARARDERGRIYTTIAGRFSGYFRVSSVYDYYDAYAPASDNESSVDDVPATNHPTRTAGPPDIHLNDFTNDSMVACILSKCGRFSG